MRSTAVPAILAAAAVGLVSGASWTMARAQGALSIANDDSIYIDASTFKIAPGKAKGSASAEIKKLGARELGPGAIVFRVSDKLYIIDAGTAPALAFANDPRRFAYDPNDPRCAVPSVSGDPHCPLIYNPNRNAVYFNDPNYAQYRLKKVFDANWTAVSEWTDRIRIEYGPPKNEEQQSVHDRLKERGALEIVQKLFKPFRLPVDLTVRAIGCDGQVNAWYEREKTGPAVTICYEYIHNIMKHAPMEITPEGVSQTDATCGQFLFVVAHEIGHALFELYSVPVFGREEDAADQLAAYFMLHLGKENARGLIGGAAFAYHNYVKDYKDNPDVRVPLRAFSSNHGSPEERYYNLMCIAYGADPKLFADVVDSGMLPKTRAGSCNYEFKTLRHAVLREIRPHLDWPMAQEIWNMRWIPDASLRTASQE